MWVEAPSEIKGKNVEDIINEWTGELEGLSRGFMRHAAQLGAWDRHILSTRHTLLDLEDDLMKVSAQPCKATFPFLQGFINVLIHSHLFALLHTAGPGG